MNWLLAPFHFSFMQSGFLAITLVGTTCAVLGCYVVLRRMAFIGDAIAHTALPGIVVAYLNSYNLFFGALVAGLLTALGIGWLSGREELREDTAIGVLFTGMFALGLLIISHTRSFRDFSSMLFGNILGVTRTDLVLISTITAIVIAVVLLFYKELELTSVDPSYSAVIGLRVNWMRNVLLFLLALGVVTGIQAVGVILTSGLLITPAAAASLLTRDLLRMMVLAAGLAIAAGFIGLYASFYANVGSGAAIVLSGSALFAIAFALRTVLNMTRRRSSVAADPAELPDSQ
jgi:ABC-type Mn2+/Zn2+ transport system permease subunit